MGSSSNSSRAAPTLSTVRTARFVNFAQRSARHLSIEHVWAAVALVAAVFALRSGTAFSFKYSALFAILALIATLPFGWLLVSLAAPNVSSRATRLALILIAGHAASTLFGFFLGVAGLQWLYLPACIALGAVAAIVALAQAWGQRANYAGSWRATVVSWWQLKSLWWLLIIGALSLIAVTPLMATRVQLTPDLFIDYTRIDAYYHLIRVHVLSYGAPASVWPDLAGVLPLVYPDYEHFWIGQLVFWSHAELNQVYFIYYPAWLMLTTIVALYAAGQALTRSSLGGYLAATAGYLAVIPNPYDTNPFFKNIDNVSAQLTAARVHFVALRTNLTFGSGAILLIGIVLVIATAVREPSHRSAAGLLVLGSLMAALLLRVRSHFFVVNTAPFALLLGAFLLFRRRWPYLVPLAVFAGLTGLIIWESTRPYYAAGTSAMVVAYGPYGAAAYQAMPRLAQWIVSSLPGIIRPLASVTGLVVTRFVGLYYGLALLLLAGQVARRRWRLEWVDVYMLAVIGCTIVAAAFIALRAWVDSDGNWGLQALFAVPPLALLLAVRPLSQIAEPFARRLGPASRSAAAGTLLVLFTLVAYRGADAILHDQTDRAYPLSAEEVAAYNWIAHNTPGLAVVAADPQHQVNQAGETIATTNFLSGETERPAYVQRVVPFNTQETQARMQLMDQLLHAHSAEEVRSLLQRATFDYLVVYADKAPSVDLTCCMKLVFDGSPRVYQVVSDPTPP